MQFSFEFHEGTLPTVRDRLLAVHGPARDPIRHDPVSQFFKAVISSRTRDEVSRAAFCSLSSSYAARWEALADISSAEVYQHIRLVTYAWDKTAHLIETASMIVAERGVLDIGILAKHPVADAFRWLLRLPGVGPKCAAATLNFSSLRMRAFVVDTHVLRVARRLGLVPRKADIARTHRLMMGLMPDRFDSHDLYELHWLMKAHGQTVCTFTAPHCSACALTDLCRYAGQKTRHSPNRKELRNTTGTDSVCSGFVL